MVRRRRQESTKRITSWRGVAFRLAAVLLGLIPFALAEWTCRIVDWGRPAYHDDPFAGFSAVRPLFVLNENGDRYEIAPSRQAYFYPDSFLAQKPRDEYRIFCLGGSTVQGRPFSIETSFTTWLELSLKAAAPGRRWEVVNCGGVSYASYRLVPILEEVLDYQPDLIIIYTGQNEYLEDRTYGHIKRMPAVFARPLELASGLRIFTLARTGFRRALGRRTSQSAKGRPILPEEVEALLDYRGGLADYHRDEKWREDVIEHYRSNLNRMVHLARDANVPVMIANPVSNLRDCPPFKAENRAGITADELQRFRSLRETARRRYRVNLYEAIETLKEVLAVDDQHAGIYYDLAKCYDMLDMLPEAREAYIKAKDLDICPLRILEPMHDVVFDVARRTGTPLLDVQRLFEELSRDGIPGSDWLVDHIHPSILGYQRIADVMADKMVRLGIVVPEDGWEQRREAAYQTHLDALGNLYFAKGMTRLENVRLWARGRAVDVRPTKKPTTNAPARDTSHGMADSSHP